MAKASSKVHPGSDEPEDFGGVRWQHHKKSPTLRNRGFLAKYGDGCRNRGAINCRDAPHELGHLKIPRKISDDRNDETASLATEPLNVVTARDTSSQPPRSPGRSDKPTTSVPPQNPPIKVSMENSLDTSDKNPPGSCGDFVTVEETGMTAPPLVPLPANNTVKKVLTSTKI